MPKGPLQNKPALRRLAPSNIRIPQRRPMAQDDAQSEEPGILFKNIAFFVLQRVPQRSTFVNQIGRNGGTLVKLEKQADITIGDRARKDNPPGAVSFQWIEECIKQAQLVDKEPFLAAPKEQQVRRPGALRPAKSTRNPFSHEDDIYLYQFLKVKERQGASLLGNQVYAELEREVCCRDSRNGGRC